MFILRCVKNTDTLLQQLCSFGIRNTF
jgi:hypothetical protein